MFIAFCLQHSLRCDLSADVDIEWDLPDLSSVGKTFHGLFCIRLSLVQIKVHELAHPQNIMFLLPL